MIKTDYEQFYKAVSEELGIQKSVVKDAYLLYWKFIKSTIEELPLLDNLTMDEFNKLRTNFNITSLGKFSCTYDRYMSTKQRYKKIQKLREIKDGKLQDANEQGTLQSTEENH